MSRLSRLFRRQPVEVAGPHYPDFPTITITIDPDGLGVRVDLPDFSSMTHDEVSRSAENLAATVDIFSSGSGKSLSSLQLAVGKAAEVGQTSGFCEYVLRLVNKMAAARGGEGPLVAPDEAFSTGGGS